MMKKKTTVLFFAASLVFTACGGGSTNPSAASGTTAGKAVDGYLSAASVLCDTNNNGIADAGEVVVTTDSLGNFAFLSACSSPLVTSGGTSIDTGLAFKGRLKAPAGSTFVTPLTSLMVDSGLSAAQIVTALGLAPGTDINHTDPVQNLDLQKKTLVIQQVIEQVTNSIAGLAQNTSPVALQAIYSNVAAAVVTTLATNSSIALINANGVNPALVSSLVTQAVVNVAKSSDTTLALVKNYSGSSVAALITNAVTTQAQALNLVSSSSDLTTQAKTLQTSPLIAQVTTQLATLLTSTVQNNVNLSAAGTALSAISAAVTAKDGAAQTAALTTLSQIAVTEAASASITVPTVSNPLLPLNVLTLNNDSIILNGTTYSLSAFEGAGVTLTKQALLIDTVSLGLVVNGKPIPVNASGSMTANISLAVELTDTGNSERVLQIMLDQASLTVDSNGQLSVVVPAGAKIYVYSKTTSGIIGNLTITTTNTDQFITAANNQLSFNAGMVLNRILSTVAAQPAGTGQQAFTNLKNVTGSFNLKMVVSNLSIATTTPSLVQGLSVSVTGSGQPAVSGLGVKGIVTLTP